jgi:predicted tellurium resistance membrane protein TerC
MIDPMDFFDIFLSFVSLTLLEIILGIDNLVFLAIISQRLPKSLQPRARRLGLTLAWVTRLLLLASAIWITKLTQPLFTIFDYAFSGRDIFLIMGGAFLLAKSTQEIHADLELLESTHSEKKVNTKPARFSVIVAQIALLDIIFSLDSVLTAIGLTQRFWLMAVAITIAIIMMIFASEPLSRFIEKHPTVKMLALSFLMLIGTILIADGFHFHVPRGYIYFAMGFSLFVEFLNTISRKRRGVS